MGKVSEKGGEGKRCERDDCEKKKDWEDIEKDRECKLKRCEKNDCENGKRMRKIMQALRKIENVKKCEREDCKNEIDWEEM